MKTYVMFGKYTTDALKAISAERTDEGRRVLAELGGELRSGYALLGEVDLVLVVDLPDNEQAIKASAALTRSLGISFTTSPAIGLEEFDALMEQ